MKLIIFLVLCVSRVFAQDISCIYELGFNGTTSYVCHMTINNPNGFDDFTEIAGEHDFGGTGEGVSDVIITSGVTTNIPRIICQQFPNIWRFNAANFPVEIQTLTENSFSGCKLLESIKLNGEITSIHPNVFMNNLNLRHIELGLVLMISIPRGALGIVTSFFGISAPLLNDLPADFFSNAINLRDVELRATGLQEFRQQWFQNLNLRTLRLSGSAGITSIPRNSLNEHNLVELHLDRTNIRQLDIFSIGLFQNLQLIDLTDTPIVALDFNIIDRGFLFVFRATGMRCASFATENFEGNRQQYLNNLEFCFIGFDVRDLAFTTTGLTPTFNSIRRDRIILGVQTPSDAIVTFSTNPDGSGSNFEVQLGVEGNSRSEIWINGVLQTSRSTPGLLGGGRFEDFGISWEFELITVFYQGSAMLSHPLPSPIAVRFAGVRTRGCNASWNIRQA